MNDNGYDWRWYLEAFFVGWCAFTLVGGILWFILRAIFGGEP